MSTKEAVKEKSNQQQAIALVVFPLRNPDQPCGQLPLGMYTNVLAALARDVTVITGNYFPAGNPSNVRIVNVKASVVKSLHEPIMSKMWRLLTSQFTLAVKLLALRKDVDIVILLFGRGTVFLPTLLAWGLRKKIIVVVTGSEAQSIKQMYPSPLGWILSSITEVIEGANHVLAQRIALESPRMLESPGIGRFKNKAVVSSALIYVDTDLFCIKLGFAERQNVVGYVGRLTAEKGVLELADAIPLVLARRSDVRFVIVGDGPLKDEMIQRLQQAGCMSSVDFTGWVPYAQVPEALNGMKVHVLPSYTESLPAANLQAMACGTISVANAVGGVLDTVVDNKTGFLLKNNRPQTIADKIIEVLDHPDLQRIQSSARTFVEGNFTYERTVERWRDVLKGTHA